MQKTKLFPKKKVKEVLKKNSMLFFSYVIGGGLAAAIDLAILWLCTDMLKLYYLLSATIAFIISFLFGYVFQKYITFKKTNGSHLRHASMFLIFQLIGQGIYMGLLRVGVTQLHQYYFFVALVAKGIVLVWNYGMNRFFTFK